VEYKQSPMFDISKHLRDHWRLAGPKNKKNKIKKKKKRMTETYVPLVPKIPSVVQIYVGKLMHICPIYQCPFREKMSETREPWFMKSRSTSTAFYIHMIKPCLKKNYFLAGEGLSLILK